MWQIILDSLLTVVKLGTIGFRNSAAGIIIGQLHINHVSHVNHVNDVIIIYQLDQVHLAYRTQLKTS